MRSALLSHARAILDGTTPVPAGEQAYLIDIVAGLPNPDRDRED